MRKGMVCCLLVLALSWATPCLAASAGEGKRAQPLDVMKARVAKSRDRSKRVHVKLRRGGSVSGRVTEVRADGFKLAPQYLNDTDKWFEHGVTTGEVLYADVLAVEYPSKTKKFFRSVGEGALLAGAVVVALPILGAAAIVSGDMPVQW